MTMEVTLIRDTPQKDRFDGTFGRLLQDGAQIAVTCEPPKPVFAPGMYPCVPHDGTEFQNVWEITHIPGHTAVLFHNGNTMKNTRGCVLVGGTYGTVDGLPAVLNSVATLNKLREMWPDHFTLTVIDAAANQGED